MLELCVAHLELLFQDRFDRIIEQINTTAEEKINAILETKMELLREASELHKSGDMNALALKQSLAEAREVAARAMNLKGDIDDNEQVVLAKKCRYNRGATVYAYSILIL